jgi:hypothetical protein
LPGARQVWRIDSPALTIDCRVHGGMTHSSAVRPDAAGFVYNTNTMRVADFIKRNGAVGGFAREIVFAALGLAIGGLVLPPLIYACGSALLGAYEGGSVAHTYGAVWVGATEGSVAAWSVIIGPYVLLLVFRMLQLWWRATPLTGR